MKTKKEAPEGWVPSEAESRLGKIESGWDPTSPSVLYYGESGVKLQAQTMPGNPSGKGGGKRGKITTWSSASRRRLREVLLTWFVPDLPCFAGSFTVPGPVLHISLYKQIWDAWRREAGKRGWRVVWRCEIQERGALHWHVILYCEDLAHMPPEVASGFVVSSWHRAVNAVGMIGSADPMRPWHTTKKGVDYYDPAFLMDVGGAVEHSAQVKTEGDRGAWLRYLQDHASKAKQAQIPENIGRHWGIINRKGFDRRSPDLVGQLSARQWSAFLRQLQRLATPVMKCDKAPFGRKLGWRCRRGSRGSSVWFSRSETVNRIMEWALSTVPAEHRQEFRPVSSDELARRREQYRAA